MSRSSEETGRTGGRHPRPRWSTLARAAVALAAVATVATLAPAAAAAPCTPDDHALCLAGGRFRVEVEWQDFQGGSGVGTAVPLAGDGADTTGAFWFFRASNLELLVKVLDGRPVNGHWWVFYGALSNVGYRLTVTDSERDLSRTYDNPAGTFASRGDTTAFPADVTGAAAAATAGPASLGAALAARNAAGSRTTAAAAPPGLAFCQRGPALATSAAAAPPPGAPRGPLAVCPDDEHHLCLGDRFRVEVDWDDFQGGSGRGHAERLTADSGTFWFFRESNVELLVKVLDGRPVNGRWWVFYGALSNVGYRLTVTDTRSGLRRTYLNPPGSFASRGDTGAFAEAPLAGYGFSPRFFASVDHPWTAVDNVRPFFAELNAAGDGVWALTRPWYDVGDDGAALIPPYDGVIGDYPRLASRLVAAVQFTDPDSGLPRVDPAAGWQATWESWNAHDGWQLFTDAAVRLAARYRPPFLSVGVEINPFARRFPEEYAAFAADHFSDLVRRVCEASPDTVVFPGFQFERLIGDLVGVVDADGRPGCDGCVPLDDVNSLSGATHPAMGDVLNAFPPAFLSHVGFTSYPYYNRDLATPADVADDYYSRLYAQVDAAHRAFVPLFTESAWPANAELHAAEACSVCAVLHPEAAVTCFPEPVYAAPCDAAAVAELAAFYADWLGGEDEQAAWAARYRQLTGALGSPLTLWLLLHDADPRNPAVIPGLFAHTGLRSHEGGTNRPAFAAWTASP